MKVVLLGGERTGKTSLLARVKVCYHRSMLLSLLFWRQFGRWLSAAFLCVSLKRFKPKLHAAVAVVVAAAGTRESPVASLSPHDRH
jgi:hypothetical protein